MTSQHSVLLSTFILRNQENSKNERKFASTLWRTRFICIFWALEGIEPRFSAGFTPQPRRWCGWPCLKSVRCVLAREPWRADAPVS